MRLRATLRVLRRRLINPRNEGVRGSNPRVGSPSSAGLSTHHKGVAGRQLFSVPHTTRTRRLLPADGASMLRSPLTGSDVEFEVLITVKTCPVRRTAKASAFSGNQPRHGDWDVAHRPLQLVEHLREPASRAATNVSRSGSVGAAVAARRLRIVPRVRLVAQDPVLTRSRPRQTPSLRRASRRFHYAGRPGASLPPPR